MEFVSTTYRLFNSNPLGSLPCLLHLNLMKSQLIWLEGFVLRPSTSSAFGERQIREIIRFAEWFLHNGKMQLFDSYLLKKHVSLLDQLRTGCSHRPPTSRLEVCYNQPNNASMAVRGKTKNNSLHRVSVFNPSKKSKVVKLFCWTFSGNMMKLGPSKCIPLRLKVWLGMTASSPPTCVQQKMFSRDPLSDSVDRMTVLNLYMFGSFQQCQILKDVASKLSISISKRKLRERDGSGRWNWLWLYLYLAGKITWKTRKNRLFNATLAIDII